LLGGGGVDGAIHRAAGPELLRVCRTLGGCPPGQARITPGFRLPARYVIHTVGPIYHGGTHGEAQVLASAYRSSLEVAVVHGLRSIAFPAISTGIYGYPLDEAASIALKTVYDFVQADTSLDLVRFVLWDDTALRAYTRASGEIGGRRSKEKAQ
jgi:O-acetyl-ADP-ribose deacetylase (regulator of RNase III)